jgi:MSHA biogenesis protein MshL
LLTSLGLILSGCVVNRPANTHVHNKIINTLGDSVDNNNALYASKKKKRSYKNLKSLMNASLVPDINVNLPGEDEEKRFNVNAADMPANKFFMSLVKGTNYNVVVDSDVTGNISLELHDVTLPEAIKAASNAYGYEYKKTDYGYRISAKKLETKIFTLNYLDMDRQGVSNMRISPSTITDVVGTSAGSTSGGSGSGTTVNESGNVKTTSKNNFWVELQATLTSMIGDKDGRKVVVNPESGLVVVQAYPKEIKVVGRYFDQLQRIMTRQVILEARVLEVRLSAEYQSGIQWKALGFNFNGTEKMEGELNDPTSILSVHTIVNPDFSAVINLLNKQGKTEVLSSPRVATLNNQKAIIKVGEDQFFVTKVSSTVTPSVTAQTTQDIDFTPFFSGISLDVIPEIDRNNNVILHIHPVISRVTEDTKSFVLGSETTTNLPMAKSTIRESDTVVHAKNGEVIVLGGLMENTAQRFDGSAPGFDDTRFDQSFGRHDKQTSKIELVILLKPIVVTDNSTAWNDDLIKAKQGFEDAKGPFRYTVHASLSKQDHEDP